MASETREPNEIMRKQVAAQCRAISHMASSIAGVHTSFAKMMESGPGPWDDILDIKGRWTAARLQLLGDMLNDMDAVTDEDEWVNPIIQEAQRLWPSPV